MPARDGVGGRRGGGLVTSIRPPAAAAAAAARSGDAEPSAATECAADAASSRALVQVMLNDLTTKEMYVGARNEPTNTESSNSCVNVTGSCDAKGNVCIQLEKAKRLRVKGNTSTKGG